MKGATELDHHMIMNALYECGLPDLGSLKKEINFLFIDNTETWLILSNLSQEPTIDDSGKFIRIKPRVETFLGCEIKCIRFYPDASCILRVDMPLNIFFPIKNKFLWKWSILDDGELYEKLTNIRGHMLFGDLVPRIY